MEIVLTRDDVIRAAEYTRKAASHFPKSNFDGNNTRTQDEVQHDVLMGRLGEVAFLRYLETTGIMVQIGREILPAGTWDVDDVCYRGWSVDVKCTSPKGNTLLLQRSKVEYREEAGELPHYFVAVKLVDECPSLEKCLQWKAGLKVKIMGFLDVRKLLASRKAFAVWARLIVPHTGLQVKNNCFAIPYSMLSQEWATLVEYLQKKKPFDVNEKKECDEDIIKCMPAEYSLCLLGDEAEKYATDRGIRQLAYWLEEGVKIQVFLPQHSRKMSMFQPLVKRFKAKKDILNLFRVYKANGDIPSAQVVDGKVSKSVFEAWKNAVPSFNGEQFEVEHFKTDCPLIVKASAGTGKTAVMVDRVLFLLATQPNLKLSEIGMITFTREAARIMRERIAEALMERFNLTRKYCFLEWTEQLGDMQISTIDSFFKDIIVRAGAELGYGADVHVRGMVHEKNEIVREVMTDVFPYDEGVNMIGRIGMFDYEYKKLVMKCWDKLNSWGIYLEDIETMDFGQGMGASARKVNGNLKALLTKAERKYRQLKKQMNALSVSDFKEELDLLCRKDAVNIPGLELKFLFVDEFQDTDSSQINTLVWLSDMLQCQLFVVGDLKQSIYRFRGAEPTAFDQLNNAILKKHHKMIEVKSLVKNYRTGYRVLNHLSGMFTQWDLRQIMKAEPVTPCAVDENGQPKQGVFECIHYKAEYGVEDAKNNDLRQKTIALLKRLQEERKNDRHDPKKKSDVICILNRTNPQVNDTAEWCQKAGIPVVAVREGGFYQCRAVQDVVALLRVILYPDDPRAVFDFLMSSYSAVQPDIEKIQACSGREAELLEYLMKIAEKSSLSDILSKSRRETFFQLIREVISSHRPEERFRALQRQKLLTCYQGTALDTQLKIDYESYKLNLRKLMKVFYTSFRKEFASILSIYDFLVLKQNTEWKEDALTAQPDKDCVVSMTVHKSKGLEFDTVILPLTTRPFYIDPETSGKHKTNDREGNEDEKKECYEFLVSQEEPRRFGWRLVKKMWNRRMKTWNLTVYKNSVFEEELNNEIKDNAAEEARILYVALTRVKNQLYYFVPSWVQSDTWADLLVKGNNTNGGRN